MHIDIVEAIRQKQYKKMESLRNENGEAVDISISNGEVVVSPGVPPGLGLDEEIEPADVPLDD
jgi:hypothetical protein